MHVTSYVTRGAAAVLCMCPGVICVVAESNKVMCRLSEKDRAWTRAQSCEEHFCALEDDWYTFIFDLECDTFLILSNHMHNVVCGLLTSDPILSNSYYCSLCKHVFFNSVYLVYVYTAGRMPKVSVAMLWYRQFCLLQVRAVGQEEQGWTALPKFPRNAGEPWAQAWPGPRHVIFGHHARRRLQVPPSCHS